MKRSKRTISAVMALAMAGSLFGCSGNGAPAASGGQASGAASGGAKQYPQIEVWVGEVRSNSEVTKVQQQWKEKLGYDVRVKNVTGDVDTALNLVLSSGGFKDMAVLPKNDVYNNSIVRSGTVMDVTDLLSSKDHPSLSSIPEQYLDVSKDKDGKYWYIPTDWDMNPDDPWPGWTRNAFRVREDLLQQTGISKDSIKTLDDYENYLRAVSKLTASNGQKYIPTTYTDLETALTDFGVKTGKAAGAVTAVEKVGDGFQFLYDNPNYKNCFKWLNHLIREGLMDEETVIQTSDIRKEKLYTGKYGSMIGFEQYDATKAGDPYRQFVPIPFPLPDGVKNPGEQFVINPYPKHSAYISKDTKNLDAVLAFMDWALEQKPERNFELNEGLEGINWKWTDKEYGSWEFDSAYAEARNNPATKANLQPELYMLGCMSNQWYPWWTQKQAEDAGQLINVQQNEEIFKYGTNGEVHAWDNVHSTKGSKWEKYGPTVDQIVQESSAKLLLAPSDAEFEAAWKNFTGDLETKGHWSELKSEWLELYQSQISLTGEY